VVGAVERAFFDRITLDPEEVVRFGPPSAFCGPVTFLLINWLPAFTTILDPPSFLEAISCEA
jgi:hypothetical protein